MSTRVLKSLGASLLMALSLSACGFTACVDGTDPTVKAVAVEEAPAKEAPKSEKPKKEAPKSAPAVAAPDAAESGSAVGRSVNNALYGILAFLVSLLSYGSVGTIFFSLLIIFVAIKALKK